MVVVASMGVTFGQQELKLDERYGVDPSKRLDNLKIINFFTDAYNTKAYDDALRYMHHIVVNSPKASQNVYIFSGNIYRSKFDLATTKAERMLYLDSILWMLDRRIEAFGEDPKRGKAYLVGLKALIYNENASDPEKSFNLFRKAIEVGGKETDPDVAVIFFNSLTEGFKLDDISAEEYLKDYDVLVNTISIEPTEEDKKALESIDAIFATSGAATCENIEAIFRPKYEANPENVDQIKMILGLFSRSKCSSDFQLQLTENYYKKEPTPELALMLAGIYEEKKDYAKSLEYINIAIKGENDPAKKINMLVRAAGANLSSNQYREAAELSRQIIAIDPSNGYGHLFLANAYAGGVSACSGFERQAAYWLVVDMFQQARSKFEGDASQMASINNAINSYASNFPKTEDTFMRGLEPGQGYSVSCGWVSGRTTVRER